MRKPAPQNSCGLCSDAKGSPQSGWEGFGLPCHRRSISSESRLDVELSRSEVPSPAISVIVTSYNYGVFLPDALGSVQAQSLQDWECIIVDDGSDDDTPEIAQAWAERDQRFVYLRQENAGPSAARNAGLSQARGRYIQILDADDTIMPDKFDVQARLLGSLPENSLVYSAYESQYDLSTRYSETADAPIASPQQATPEQSDPALGQKLFNPNPLFHVPAVPFSSFGPLRCRPGGLRGCRPLYETRGSRRAIYSS